METTQEVKVKCPKCKRTLKEQPITKGNKVIGTNLFCTNPKCNYEKDI